MCNICISKLYHHEIKQTLDFYSPAAIYKAISSHVSGQDEAIKEISVTLFKHSLLLNKKIDANFASKIKTNSIIMGPTGTGKTYIMEIAAKILNIPILIVDATQLTAAGYVGDDVESMLARMIKLSGSAAKAEKGIIFLDEVDKISKRETTNHKDIGGESVQQELLRIFGGTHIDVNLDGKKPYAFRTVKFYTGKMLFICAGCFDGINSYIGDSNIKGNLLEYGINAEQDYFTRLRTALIKYGFIPEFIGRFSSIIRLNSLSEQDMVNILLHAESKMTYYKRLMSQYGVTIDFDQTAILAMAKYAVKINIGARAIDDVLEKIFNKHIFNIDVYKVDTKIIINSEVISHIINNQYMCMK
jgi:ATP-dependent Clp protease ATP-binding subunit ClpX